jgi:hypothetical protein
MSVELHRCKLNAFVQKIFYLNRLYVLIFLCFCLQFQTGFSQTKTIDSLKKVLPSLHDTARIECLNELSIQYRDIHNQDSALYYANISYEESKKINYVHGLAEAYLQKAFMANFFYNDFSQMEKMASEAIKWFNLTSNKKDLDNVYGQLSFAQYRQSNYEEALYNSKLCYEWAKKTGDQDGWDHALEEMTNIYRERGDNDKLLEAQGEIIQGERMRGDSQDYTIHELWVMGLMYMLLEEYPTALSYWRRLFVERKNNYFNTWNQMEYARLLTLSNQPDSALYYYNHFDSAKADKGNLRFFLVSKGEYYLFLREYDKALSYFMKGLIYNRQLNDRPQAKRALLDIAKTYAALNNNDSAIKYVRDGLSMALQTESKPYIRDGYEILYSIYDRLRQTDSAYYYYHRYMIMKEAVMNDQTRGKLAAYKYEHKIELLDKEKLISDQRLKIQQQQLGQESLQKKILVGGIIGLFLIGLIVFRTIMLKRRNEKLQLENELRVQQLQNEKTKAEMQKQATQLEIQALRAQMNPHFIFNCLNSINRFIISNNAPKAADYLTKFAKLIRIVLQQSGKSFIPLEDELYCLQLYMDLEALRFEIPFSYKMNCNGINTSSVMIPSLLIQPFVENAIWHGLHPTNNGGRISIDVNMENDLLHCKICDNGIGRVKANVFKQNTEIGKKSLGIKLTQNRLQLIDPLKQKEAGVAISDLTDEAGQNAGTCVHIKIPVKTI